MRESNNFGPRDLIAYSTTYVSASLQVDFGKLNHVEPHFKFVRHGVHSLETNDTQPRFSINEEANESEVILSGKGHIPLHTLWLPTEVTRDTMPQKPYLLRFNNAQYTPICF